MGENRDGSMAGLPQVRDRSGTGVPSVAGQLPPHPLDAEWHLHIDGQTYGPYSGHRIKEFVAEGRVVASTNVLRAGSDQWGRAIDDPTLGALLVPQPLPPKPPASGNVSAKEGATVVQVTNNLAPNPVMFVDDGGPAGLKSPGIALLLSLLICGVGQMYNGQVAKGILMFLGGLLLWVIFLGWIIWLWSMIDAYQTAKAMNLRYQRRLLAGLPT